MTLENPMVINNTQHTLYSINIFFVSFIFIASLQSSAILQTLNEAFLFADWLISNLQVFGRKRKGNFSSCFLFIFLLLGATIVSHPLNGIFLDENVSSKRFDTDFTPRTPVFL